MGYPTDSASWPAAIPSPVVQLYDRMFTLTDTVSDTAGEQMAAEVFTEDGIFLATSGNFKGAEALRTCRKGVWKTVTSRRHQIKKAYLSKTEGNDVLDVVLIGSVEVEKPEDGKHAHEFVVRSVIVGAGSSTPRIKHYQVIIPAPKVHQTILE